MAEGQKQGQGADEMYIFIGLAAFILILMFLIPRYQWIFFEYWRWNRIIQFTPFTFIDLSFFREMGEYRDILLNHDSFTKLRETYQGLSTDQRTKLNGEYWEFIGIVDSKYTRYFSWLSAGFLGYLGFKLLKASSKITKIYNFETFLQSYSITKDYYKDILGKGKRPDEFDHLKSKGDAVVPMTPYEFATSTPPPNLNEDRPIFDPEAYIFDEQLAGKAFDAQLGKPWRGPKSLTESQTYIYDTLKAIVEKKTDKKAEEIMDKHAFFNTGIKTLYQEAKLTGVVAPSWFRQHIKYKDRFLWRVISDTGRLPMVMCAGIHAHHELEVVTGEPIKKPATEEAVYALAETVGYDVTKLSNGQLN